MKYLNIITISFSFILSLALILESYLKYLDLKNPIIPNNLIIITIGELIFKSVLIILVIIFQLKLFKQQKFFISSFIYILSLLIYNTKEYFIFL